MTTHPQESILPIPEIRLGPQAASVERVSGIIGVIGLAFCVLGFLFDRAVFFQSYLFAFIYWGGFALGGLGVLLMGHTVGGRWCATARRFLEAQMVTLWVVAIFVVILVAGRQYLYPWMHISAIQDLGSRNVLYHKRGYLNSPFFIGRVVIYFLVWWFWGLRVRRMADRQDETGDPTLRERMRAFSAPGVLVFTMTATFAYIDWILSADAQFFSTVYGAMILIGDVVQCLALTILAMILTSRGDRFGGRINAVILHDLGNLMFAFVIFWTYLTASQLIIVWPANLPQELIWYLDRVHGFWKYLAGATALSMFAIPFLALLSQTRKRDPRRLMRVCIWLLLARIVDIYWIVLPTFRNHGFWMSWTDFATFFGLGGIWIFVFVRQLRKRPLLPLRDPRVMPPLKEVHA
ncbi:MAG TPA: hypothetical protein VHU83_08665 [Bryobacteraceae bacterium]|jgi:hypothetical protein|nr:hypothetical protein [Bryobacteraceae bacterium]